MVTPTVGGNESEVVVRLEDRNTAYRSPPRDDSVRGTPMWSFFCVAFVVSLVIVVVMSFNNRRDVSFDNVKVKEGLQLPGSQTLVKSSISYNSASNSVVYSDGLGVYDIGSTLPGSTLVFRPGDTSSSSSIFSSWSELCAVLEKLPAPKTVYMDNSLLASTATPMVIPAGDWDMSGTTIKLHQASTQVSQTRVLVTIADGATLNGLLEISGPLEISYDSSTQSCIEINQTATSRNNGLVLSDQVYIENLGTSPFLNVNTTGTYFITMRNNVVTSGSKVFNSETGAITINMYVHSTLSTNAPSGGGTVQIIPFTPDNIIVIPLNYPLVTGTLVYLQSNIAGCSQTYPRSTSPAVTDDASKGYKVGDIWIDQPSDRFYLLTDASNGAAIWRGPL